jgi:ATP-binding cassette subfamily B protein
MSTNRNTLNIYWTHVKNHKASFIISLIAVPASALLLDTLLPFYLSQAIGGLTHQNEQLLTNTLILAATVGLVGALLNYIGFQALIRHESSVRKELSDSVFSSLLSKDLRFFVNEKVGSLTSRYIDFIRSHMTLQDLLIMRTLGFILSVGVGVVIVALHSLLVAAILVGLLVVLVIQVKVSLKIRKPYREKRKKVTGEIHGKVADAITNSLIVKTFAQEKSEVDNVSVANEELRVAYMKDFKLLSTEGSARLFVMTITQLIAISICATLVFHGQLDLAIAIFTITYLQRIGSQLFSLGEMLNGYDQALLDAAPMSDILMQKNEVVDRPNAQSIELHSPHVELKNVSYHYGDSDIDVMSDINLDIKAGQKIGLVGPSGAGKTTITHLLLRFADVTGGAILFDGHDIRDITQESLRTHIAYVPQEPMLFHRSLRENIAYGKLDASDEEIERAATLAHASEFIEKLPEGLDTVVGERGVKLSGGQRQRIAIARAILKDAPILVLDEATSALDSESEKLIQDALQKLMKNRTSIVIAHRLSTIAKLDRVIVLADGAIAEEGTHTQLLAKKGLYARLWAHQSGGFIEE